MNRIILVLDAFDSIAHILLWVILIILMVAVFMVLIPIFAILWPTALKVSGTILENLASKGE